MPDAPRTLPCCTDVPPAFVPRARYALATLLRPLGLVPGWTASAALPEGGIYYGAAPASSPQAALALPHAPAAAAYFASGRPYPVEDVRWHRWDGETWPVLFGGDAPDLVASAFFWLSGWQEHVTDARDAHGRFPHGASLQVRLGTTVRPVVDAYRERLARLLSAAGVPSRRRRWAGRAWALCPTHDVDYLRKWRPGIVYRELVEHFALNRRGDPAGERVRRLGRVLRDWLAPGDPYRRALERMHAEVAQRGGTATYFVKTGAHDPHDVAYDPAHPYLRRRLDALAASGFAVGLHPSYRAHDRGDLLRAECDRLAAVTGAAPRSVRQHYLRYALPATPRLHQDLGFAIDSTLGFAEHEGFRHATCVPFQLYDVEVDVVLDVWEMPLAVMESTLFNRRGLDAAAAREATGTVLQACRRFGGAAVMLWHNTLWDELDCPGWGRHFVETLDAARDGGAYLASLEDALDAWR